jgi:long-chain acyl-CoA synthetase
MLARLHRIQPKTRLLCVLPLHHVNGLGFTIFATLIGGGHTFLTDGFDPITFWPIVQSCGVHIVSLVPNLLRLLSRQRNRDVQDSGPILYAVSAAAPLSVAVAQLTWERLGLQIVQGYGLSEVTNFSCSIPTDLTTDEYERWMLAGNRTSVGPALPGQEVQVCLDNQFAEPGIEGEIVIRGPCVMSGYLHDQEATDEAFHDGWFHTGDLGYWLPGRRETRYIHITGRKREIAKRSGVLVSLLEVDEVLASIPGVADAGCAGFVNIWVGEEIGAFIVPEPGCHLTADGILHACRHRLPYAAIPKLLQFVDVVPRTSTGKILRVEIAERFSAAQDTLFADRYAK